VPNSDKGSYAASSWPAETPIFRSCSLRDLLKVCRHLGIHIPGCAARRHTGDDMDIESLTDRMEEETDSIAWVALDTLFHITIGRVSLSPALQKVIEEIRDALGRRSRVLNQVSGGREVPTPNTADRRVQQRR